jgi:hypothetical protein
MVLYTINMVPYFLMDDSCIYHDFLSRRVGAAWLTRVHDSRSESLDSSTRGRLAANSRQGQVPSRSTWSGRAHFQKILGVDKGSILLWRRAGFHRERRGNGRELRSGNQWRWWPLLWFRPQAPTARSPLAAADSGGWPPPSLPTRLQARARTSSLRDRNPSWAGTATSLSL